MISISTLSLTALTTQKSLKVYDQEVALPQLTMSAVSFLLFWLILFLF
jgi:hypothetical protein